VEAELFASIAGVICGFALGWLACRGYYDRQIELLSIAQQDLEQRIQRVDAALDAAEKVLLECQRLATQVKQQAVQKKES